MSPEGQSHLEDRLQALLESSDLDLPPRQDATGLVVGRVRRAKRRRRAVQTVIPAVLTMATIAIGVSVFHHHPEEAPAQGPANILTGTGIGPLRIGMDVTTAQDTGLLGKNTDKLQGELCQTYEGRGGFVVQVLVDHNIVTGIKVNLWVDTPAGIHVGNTYGELRKAYPDAPKAQPSNTLSFVKAPGGKGNEYQVDIEEPDTDVGQTVSDQSRISGLALVSPTAVASAKCRFV